MSKTQIATGGIADDAVTVDKATGFGKILQVVNTEFNTTQNGSAGADAMITGYFAQITPSATSSKVLILFSGGVQIEDSNSAARNAHFKLRVNNGSNPSEGSTDIQQVRYGSYGYNDASGTIEEHQVLVFNALHSPSTTGSFHVGISVGNYDGNPNWKIGISNYKSAFTLMEIAG
tara:strand:- start:10 stop:534 length:525 start_codon:yes stop_codon:yes gene_type:complete